MNVFISVVASQVRYEGQMMMASRYLLNALLMTIVLGGYSAPGAGNPVIQASTSSASSM